MRYGQSWFVDDLIPEQHEIQIQRTGSAWKRPLAAACRFDGLQRREQLSGRQPGFADEGRVQKERLAIGNANRIRLVGR